MNREQKTSSAAAPQPFNFRSSGGLDEPSVADELKLRLAFLQLGPDDAERLATLLPELRALGDRFVDQFYEHLFAFPEAAKVLNDAGLVSRLKQAQKLHLESMLAANWDESYVTQRRRVGNTHAEVGISPQFFLGAYIQYIQFFLRCCGPHDSPQTAEFLEQTLSLLKAIFLDIGLTLDTYFFRCTQTMGSALDMLWRSNSELRQFAQLASHDLKTPLATVANLCDEALDESGDSMPSSTRELIESAKQRIYRMSAMIDQLLQTANASVESDLCEEIASDNVIAEAVDRLRPMADHKGVSLEVTPPLPYVFANKVKLREAIYNLVSNAVKFNDHTNAWVRISAKADNQHCVFEISDNGPGITVENMERIFAPFRRLAMHKGEPGSGLGLYFAKHLTEQQGGRLWAESECGKGSRFYISLHRRAP